MKQKIYHVKESGSRILLLLCSLCSCLHSSISHTYPNFTIMVINATISLRDSKIVHWSSQSSTLQIFPRKKLIQHAFNLAPLTDYSQFEPLVMFRRSRRMSLPERCSRKTNEFFHWLEDMCTWNGKWDCILNRKAFEIIISISCDVIYVR